MKKGLLFLMLSVLTLGAWADGLSSPFTGSSLATGNFYLYNVKSGKWLQNNNTRKDNWTTRASVGLYGLEWTIGESTWDASGYAIGARFGQPSIWNGDFYIDYHNDGSTWTITSTSVSGVSNAYKIASGTNALGAKSYDETNKANNLFTETETNRWYLVYPNSGKTIDTDGDIWQLVTKEERLRYMESNASLGNPIDATWLIDDPDFSNNNERHSSWKLNNSGNNGNSAAKGNADNDNQRGARIWEQWRPKGNNTFDYYQIMDVPNGVYTLQLQGFTRHGQPAESESVLYSEKEVHTVYYYANDVKNRMKSIFDDSKSSSSGSFTEKLDNSYYTPNSTDLAAKAINNENAYINPEINVIVTNGKLRIGVKREESDASRAKADWTVIDNFKLTYYGPYISDGDYYLYNVGSGLWLQNNDKKTSEYTTRAELGERGMNVGIVAITGGYKLNPYFNNNGSNHSINGDNLYMDTKASVTSWQISSVPDTDYVTIKSGSNLLGSDGSANKYLTVSSSLSGNNAYWRLYTAEEYYNLRKTEMLTATQASPKDATWMITDPTFPAFDERETAWTKMNTGDNTNNDLEGDKEEKGGVKCNCIWESWNSSSHSFQQELTNLPAGVYRMSVQGFYNSGANTYLPYYFVENTTSGKVQNNFMRTSEGEHESTGGCATSATLGGGDGQFWASKCIYNGHYQNQWIYFVVGTDNEATTIGVKKEGQKGQDWLVYDNFKLEYLGSGYEISFNENNTSIDEINGLATRITMTRSMQNDRWNTFCVPFAITGSQITEQFGSGSQVKELSGAVKNGKNYTMTFTDADDIVAGKPYMVKPANNVSSIELTNASGIAVNTTGTPSVTEDGVTFTGVYANGNAPLGSFIISNNKFYNVDSDVTLKAFRGYITVDGGSAGVKALDFTFDDDATGISLMEDGRSQMEDGAIYNLAGQRISKMQKGINIVNGKKIMVK